MTATIRTHFQKSHYTLWRALVVSNKAKGWEQLHESYEKHRATDKAYINTTFTLEGFYERLTRWIVVDDQVGDCALLWYSY